MFAARTVLCLLSITVLATSTFAADTILEVVPGSIDFGQVDYKDSAKPAKIIVTATHEFNDGFVEVTDVRLEKKNAGFSIDKVSPPLMPKLTLNVSRGDKLSIVVGFSPTNVGLLTDTLIIELHADDKTQERRIELSAQGRCSDILQQDCDPIGPRCRISENISIHSLAKIADYTNTVSPAILQHKLAHYRSSTTYTLPATYLLSITGMKSIVGNLGPLKPDDEEVEKCLPEECKRKLLPPIKFNRVPGTKTLADFEWLAPPEKPTLSASIPVHPGGKPLFVNITLPDKIGGRAVISASYVEFHFRTKPESPKLQIRYDGKTVFDDSIHCMNVTMDYSTIRSFKPLASGSVGILINDEKAP